MSAKDHFAKLQTAIDAAPVIPPSTRQRGSGAVSAPVQLAHFSVEFQTMQRDLERLQKEGGRRKLALAALRSSPYQVAGLVEARVVGLVANLAENELNTPIVVRKIGDSELYEIVSGHHRVEAFRRLGREEIDATVVVLTDEQAQSLLFFDNLYAPSLSDFEKYLYFKAIRSSTGWSLEVLAKKAGIGYSTLQRLLASFDALPGEAHAIIRRKMEAVGAMLAEELAPQADKAGPRLLECLEKVVAGELTQAAALRWLVNAPAAVKARVEPLIVRAGQAKFAEITRRDSVLAVRFKDPGDAAALENVIFEFLQAHAKKKKK